MNNIIEDIKSILNKHIMIYDFTYNYDTINTFKKMINDSISTFYKDNTDIDVNLFNIGDIEIKYKDYLFIFSIRIQDINKTYGFPNMLSIKKAKDILSDNNKYLFYIFIEYEELNNKIKIDNINLQKIESLDWSYLYIQNIGRGQLQVKNISRTEFIFNNDMTRNDWLKSLNERGSEYYDNLILKVVEYKTEWEKE